MDIEIQLVKLENYIVKLNNAKTVFKKKPYIRWAVESKNEIVSYVEKLEDKIKSLQSKITELEGEVKGLTEQIKNRNKIIELTNQDMISLNGEIKNLKEIIKTVFDAGKKLLAEGK